jgi:hypothetical protein
MSTEGTRKQEIDRLLQLIERSSENEATAPIEEIESSLRQDGFDVERLRSRFSDLKRQTEGVERRRLAARSLTRTRELIARIRQGLHGDERTQAIDRLQAGLGSSRPELAACFRSLKERSEQDEAGMLEDLATIQRYIQEVAASDAE